MHSQRAIISNGYYSIQKGCFNAMPQQTTFRAIQPNHGNPLPQLLISFDCESRRTRIGAGHTPTTHAFRLSTVRCARIENLAATRSKAVRCTTAAATREFIYAQTSQRYTTWVVAHSLLFDFITAGFPEDCDSGLLVRDAPRAKRQRQSDDPDEVHNYGICVIEGPPTIIAFRHTGTGGRIVFVDSLNWFRCPLRELGQSIGLPKLDMPDWSADDDQWFAYCERDTDIVFEAMLKLIRFNRENQLGVFRYTTPSQSMSAFRHGRMPRKVYPHDNIAVKAMERHGNFGGRSECFRLGTINHRTHYVDANSMYPYIMLNTKCPWFLKEYELNGQGTITLDANTAHLCMATCDIQTSSPLYPVRRENIVCFPTGRFTTTLCGMELAIATRRGDIANVRSIAQYKSDYLFEVFITDMLRIRGEARIKGDEAYVNFAKMLANALHAKFAQKPAKWVDCPDIPELPNWCYYTELGSIRRKAGEYRKVFDTCQRKNDEGERDDTFIAISAFITSAARVYMNQVRECAGKDNVYYQGTDGLIVNDEGLTELQTHGYIHPTELGKFKIKASGSPLRIMGISNFQLGDYCVLAGLPKSAQQMQQDEWDVCTLAVKDELFRGRPPAEIVERRRTFRYAEKYLKMHLNPDGTTTPFQLGMFDSDSDCASNSVEATTEENLATRSNQVANGTPEAIASDACSIMRSDSSRLNPAACRLFD